MSQRIYTKKCRSACCNFEERISLEGSSQESFKQKQINRYFEVKNKIYKYFRSCFGSSSPCAENSNSASKDDGGKHIDLIEHEVWMCCAILFTFFYNPKKSTKSIGTLLTDVVFRISNFWLVTRRR